MCGIRAELIDGNRAPHGDRFIAGADIARNRFLRRSAFCRNIDRFCFRNGSSIGFITLINKGLRAVRARVSGKRAVDIRALAAESDFETGTHRIHFARIIRRDIQI